MRTGTARRAEEDRQEGRKGAGSQLRRFGLRYRMPLQDLGLLAFGLAVVAYVLVEFEIMRNEATANPRLELFYLNELMLLSTILGFGLFAYAVRRYRVQRRETLVRRDAERKARELAYQDPLTGLANRRQFEEALVKACVAKPEIGKVHAVLLLDLNGFKDVNDTHGHGVGDDVLVIVAERLLGAVRDGDLLARLGGDEFVLLSRHLIGPEAAASVAIRVLASLEEPILTAAAEHRIGAGCGIALLPRDADNALEALRTADVALYRAKEERRSAFRFFEPAMDAILREREQLERDLHRALRSGDFRARFSPSFDLENGEVAGFEIIPAWVREDGSEVAPERFVPLAEATGHIHQLAMSVLSDACRAVADWDRNVRLSMDVLPSQLKNPRFGDELLGTLAANAFPPNRFEIEVAESTIVQDFDIARQALGPLRQAGVTITLDNFGTGYSNLYHMRELQIDKVKIARRLIEDGDEADGERFVRALAGFGHGLGLSVCADGHSDARNLASAGVSQGQAGGGPIGAEEARRLTSPISDADAAGKSIG